MSISERRFELRNRTREGHQRLDAAVGTFATRMEYRRYVAFLNSFRAAMDLMLRDVSWPRDWKWQPTSVSEALSKDTADLDLEPASPENASVKLGDESSLLGALYVLEGSTLGARVLKSRAAALGLDDAFGARHLALMANAASQWQSFLSLLDDAQDFDIDHAAQSANAVFELAMRCLDRETAVYS